MSVFSRVRSVFLLALLLLVQSSMAASRNDRGVRSNSNFEEEEQKTWTEIEVQLPAFPEEEDLISFKVGAVDDVQYAIDSQSLSVGTDDVIRFTLVTVSSMGAKSISYEGMRCLTAERRYYASGRPDKTWSKARSNQWFKIKGGSSNHHFELFANYFCPIGSAFVTSAEEAVRALRRGGISNARR